MTEPKITLAIAPDIVLVVSRTLTYVIAQLIRGTWPDGVELSITVANDGTEAVKVEVGPRGGKLVLDSTAFCLSFQQARDVAAFLGFGVDNAP